MEDARNAQHNAELVMEQSSNAHRALMATESCQNGTKTVIQSAKNALETARDATKTTSAPSATTTST